MYFSKENYRKCKKLNPNSCEICIVSQNCHWRQFQFVKAILALSPKGFRNAWWKFTMAFFERRACEHTCKRITKKTVAVWGLPSSLQMCYMISAAGALSFTRRIMSVDADKWKGNLWPKNNVTTKVPHIGLPVLADVADSIKACLWAYLYENY